MAIEKEVHMETYPPHINALEEAITKMWQNKVARFTFVPTAGGFAVIANHKVALESKLCTYDKLEEHYIGCIKNDSPYWRTNPVELPNQKFMGVYRMMVRHAFMDVFIQKGTKRIEITFYVPVDYHQT